MSAAGRSREERVRRFYDAHAPAYESKFRRFAFTARAREKEEADVWAAIERHVTPDMRVLELGAGTGLYTVRLARLAREVAAVDLSPEMLARLRARLEAEGLENVRVVEGPAGAPPVEGPFDAMVAAGLTEYVRDFGAVLERAGALSARLAVYTVPRRGALGRLYRAMSLARKRVWLHLYSEREVRRDLARGGFELAELTEAGARPLGLASGTWVVVGKRREEAHAG